MTAMAHSHEKAKHELHAFLANNISKIYVSVIVCNTSYWYLRRCSSFVYACIVTSNPSPQRSPPWTGSRTPYYVRWTICDTPLLCHTRREINTIPDRSHLPEKLGDFYLTLASQHFSPV